MTTEVPSQRLHHVTFDFAAERLDAATQLFTELGFALNPREPKTVATDSTQASCACWRSAFWWQAHRYHAKPAGCVHAGAVRSPRPVGVPARVLRFTHFAFRHLVGRRTAVRLTAYTSNRTYKEQGSYSTGDRK
jgi:hypothetical protein